MCFFLRLVRFLRKRATLMFSFAVKRPVEKGWTAWLQVDNSAPCPVTGPCSIGRAKTNTVCIPSEKVSRLHALVQAQKWSEHWLIDLGSSNGTYLNARRVIQPSRLKDGDLIQIGEHRILFFLREPGEEERNAALEEDEMTVREMQHTACWFLVADIENLVALGSEMTPGELAKVVGEWFAACHRIINEHQGTIIQYLGDGLVAYWDGTRIPANEIAESLDTMKKMRLTSRLKFRLAAHFGKANVAGSPIMGDTGLFGSDVNITFRMQKLAKTIPVECILSEEAYEALSRPQAATRVGYHAVQGFKEKHMFYAL